MVKPLPALPTAQSAFETANSISIEQRVCWLLDEITEASKCGDFAVSHTDSWWVFNAILNTDEYHAACEMLESRGFACGIPETCERGEEVFVVRWGHMPENVSRIVCTSPRHPEGVSL